MAARVRDSWIVYTQIILPFLRICILSDLPFLTYYIPRELYPTAISLYFHNQAKSWLAVRARDSWLVTRICPPLLREYILFYLPFLTYYIPRAFYRTAVSLYYHDRAHTHHIFVNPPHTKNDQCKSSQHTHTQTKKIQTPRKIKKRRRSPRGKNHNVLVRSSPLAITRFVPWSATTW